MVRPRRGGSFDLKCSDVYGDRGERGFCVSNMSECTSSALDAGTLLKVRPGECLKKDKPICCTIDNNY